MGIVLKELKESHYWLTLAAEAKLVNGERIEALLKECEELGAIIGKSILTAKRNMKQVM